MISVPTNYENSVTLASLAAYYMQQGGTMSRLLPKSLYNRYCLAKAYVSSADKSRLLILPYLELCITTRCSLKCINCANLMQYYDTPKDYDTERIIASIDRLLECVDAIDCFRILGGEPFMHKDSAFIIRYCADHKKLLRVEVVTNGTIVPTDEVLTALAHKKASVYTSDYGDLSCNSSALKKILSQRGITTISDSNYQWQDMGAMQRRAYSAERVSKVYRQCEDICKTMVDGVVYVCPRAAHGVLLGIVPKRDRDCVDIFAGTTADVRHRLRELYEVDHVEACYYCNAVEDRNSIAAGGEQGRLSFHTTGVQE